MSHETTRKKEFLNSFRSYRVPEKMTYQAISQYYSSLNSPRALTCHLLLKYKEYDQLVNLECDPANYNDVAGFRDAYQATKFMSKNRFLSLSIDRRQVALDKFDQMEELCRQTNKRFQHPESDQLLNWSNASLHAAMIRKISQVLGPFSAESVFGSANWGPGVTTLLKGENVSATNKFQHEVGITRDLYALLFQVPIPYRFSVFAEAYPRWQELLENNPAFPTFVAGNVVITVPKNSKTDRVIAVEPGLNLWLQKGVGQLIKRRLGFQGIDLTRQSRNQRLAREGSIYPNAQATVDFSSASDSIAIELVRSLLPPDWFNVLDTCRSHFGVSDSKPRRWAKFSSMGNGFTFELESLIFYAAAAVICEKAGYDVGSSVSVYGDDVIIPRELFDDFSLFSEYLGFKVNLSKSYADGHFRESCGSYWYKGVDVQPIFLQEMVRTPLQVFRLANAIRKQARSRVNFLGCDSVFKGVWKLLVNSLPKALRLRIDISLGDGGFISNFDEASPSRARGGQEGYLVTHVVEVGLTGSSDEEGHLLAQLRKTLFSHSGGWESINFLNRTLSMQESKNTYSLRGRVKLRRVRSLVARWTDLGPWF
jgi:hypothetical protein